MFIITEIFGFIRFLANKIFDSPLYDEYMMWEDDDI